VSRPILTRLGVSLTDPLVSKSGDPVLDYPLPARWGLRRVIYELQEMTGCRSIRS
jgi:hypothetical protein